MRAGFAVLAVVCGCGRIGFATRGGGGGPGGDDGPGGGDGPRAVGTITTYTVSTYPQGLATGDFDGDGKLDIVATGTEVAILRGDGAGGFAPAVMYAAGGSSDKVAVGDLDLDGALDLVVTDETAGVFALFGDGTGAFSAAKQVSTIASTNGVAIGDLDDDGKPDIVFAARVANEVEVSYGLGARAFKAPAGIAVDPSPSGLVLHDFDGDGSPDAVVTCWGGNAVDVLQGAKLGFKTPAKYTGVGLDHAQGVWLTDFNGDGRDDLAVSSAATLNDHATVMLGGAGLSFGTPTGFAVMRSATGAVAGDADGDGKADMVVNNYNTVGSVSVLFGDGTGALGTAITIPTDPEPIDIGGGDFNGDGILDVAVANTDNSEITVLLGPLR